MSRIYNGLISKCISILGLCVLVGCVSQNPAPYIDNSSNVYAKGRVINPQAKASSGAPSDPYAESDIVETKLAPIEDKKSKEEKEVISAVETETQSKDPQSKNLTDIDLEEQINQKQTVSQVNSMAAGGVFKLATPIDDQKFQWPIDGEILSRYGKIGNKFNEGINIAAPLGAPVVAASDGKVVYIGNKLEGYGNLIIIKHDKDIMTAYAHLKDIVVERGATIKRGESIGSVGQAGNVSQPQLHFSMRKGKKTINPEIASS